MQIDELIQIVTSYTGSTETELLLTTCFQIASEAHKGFQRINGVPYLSHSLAVANKLAEWHARPHIVAVGLLHDIFSPDYSHRYDWDVVQSRIDLDSFHLLEAIVSLNNSIRRVEREIDSGNSSSTLRHYRDFFLRQNRDAVVIKIADRLHNLQTISALTPRSQAQTARVALNLLVPLADSLGMGSVKRQLEDHYFEIINPTYYRMLLNHYTEGQLSQEVQAILEVLQQQIHSKTTLKSQVKWQPTSLYALSNRQKSQNLKLGQLIRAEPSPLRLIDAGAFIILTEDDEDCYRILGVLHKIYSPVKGQIRDFIADPKDNGYRSLHTQVKDISGNPLHVIIRTHTMDLVVEHGITARWWNVSEELLPRLPKETRVTDGEMQVFTPKGQIKYLPQNATVLDFAYHIHSDVGHRCIGALVNGKQAALSQVLQSGDSIEITIGGAGTAPSITWLDIVQTPLASNRIRQGLVQLRRDEMLERGRDLLDHALQSLGCNSSNAKVHQLLSRQALKENLGNAEDLLASIGVGRHKVSKVISRLKSMGLTSVKTSNHVDYVLPINILSPDEARLLPVLAQCCNPMPPDDIVGYRRSDQKLAIHTRVCPQVKELKKTIQVKWDTTSTEPNYVIVVEARDRPSLTSDLSTVIAHLGFGTLGFNVSQRADGITAEAIIYLGKTTLVQCNRIQKALEDVSYVNKVDIIPISFLTPPASQPPLGKEMIYRTNPYGPTIAAGTRFYGREAESQRISAILRDQSQNTAIVLWGQKRIGKTSLVLRLEEQARGDFLPIYLDVQRFSESNTTWFLYQLMIDISRTLLDNLPDSREVVTVTAFRNLRKDPLSHFDTFMALLQELIQKYPLVVILDEFQCLCRLHDETVSRAAIFSRLRSHSQHGHGVHFILSGGGLLSQLIEQCDIGSLFSIAHDEKLSCLETQAARQLIMDGLVKAGNITERASELLLENTAGHPYYLQLLCSMLYDQAQGSKTALTSHDVARCINEWLRKADSSRFQHLWEGHDSVSAQRNKLILSAIAELTAKNPDVEYDRLSTEIGIVSEQKLVQSLQDLADLGVLEQKYSNYSIKVELFARWLRQHWPLKLTLKETL